MNAMRGSKVQLVICSSVLQLAPVIPSAIQRVASVSVTLVGLVMTVTRSCVFHLARMANVRMGLANVTVDMLDHRVATSCVILLVSMAIAPMGNVFATLDSR